ncbi:MAG: 50S ribosomal protein L4 [bacterium]
MAQIHVYNQKGEKQSDLTLNDKIFGVSENQGLLHQAVRTQLANRRVAIAHTKTRGEVAGTGKKPWKQKGTGRARHGSVRSPIWVGGGVTFGPTSAQNFSLKMPKKARKQALCMALSAKLSEDKLFALDKLELTAPKTKEFAQILKSLPGKGELLLVIDAKNENVEQAAKNLESVWVARPEALNIVDIIKFRRMAVLVGAVSKIEKLFSK